MQAMNKSLYVMIGGFLGAGKTTAILRLAEHLVRRQLRVGLITNDQSVDLVVEFPEPQGAQIIRHAFTVRVHEVRWDIDPAALAAVESWPESFDPYLRSVTDLAGAPVYGQVLATIATAAGAPPVFAAMDWIDQNLTYDHVEASLRGSADWAFSRRRGHCSDYHGLCQTFGRSLGTPTRVTYGINLFPKNSPSHCKIEAFLPPYGWVSFDLSETQKLVKQIAADGALSGAEKRALADAARRRLRSGFRDNTWMLWTRGTNYELAPRASNPVAVIRTIYAEADGESLPDPDPANINQRMFGWMTAHKYTPDRKVSYPFKDLTSLEDWKGSAQREQHTERSKR
jgi:transglutaminase-like putative cysteine protease